MSNLRKAKTNSEHENKLTPTGPTTTTNDIRGPRSLSYLAVFKTNIGQFCRRGRTSNPGVGLSFGIVIHVLFLHRHLIYIIACFLTFITPPPS